MAEAPADVPAVRIDAGPLSCQVLAEVPSRCASLLRRSAVRLWCPGLGEAPRKFASARSLWPINRKRWSQSVGTRRYGVGAPKNTPAEIVDKLNKVINAGLADSKFIARLANLGGTILAGWPADFGKLISDETMKWGKVVKFVGIKAD